MTINKYIKKTIIVILSIFLLTGCSFGKTETKSETKVENEKNLTVEERIQSLSDKLEVKLQDYTEYYKENNITKCLMATKTDIMYSYNEFETEDLAKKRFEEGMKSYETKDLLKNKTDKYTLYEIQQTLKTTKTQETIDKKISDANKDKGVDVKYTTYNVLEGKVIVSIMAPTDNDNVLKTALDTMNYKLK